MYRASCRAARGERMKGTRQESENGDEVQRHPRGLFKPNKLDGVFLARVGAEFLLRKRSLLA